MDTGMRIKYNRLKKRISIENLASGILPPKELKKIEASMKEPTLDELQALCKRLEIPLASKDNPVGKVLVKNFKSLLLHSQDKVRIIEQYADIHDHPLLHNDEEIELEYKVQQIRFFIITGDLDSAEDKLKEIERFKEFMNQEQFYLYHKYWGNYHYILDDVKQALKTYLLAERVSPSNLSSTELGDLYYSIALSSSRSWELNIANKYAGLALKIYQQEFVPKRIVECHLTIAINERRIGNFTTAKEHFKYAFTIGNKIDNDFLKFNTEYNYGYYYYQLQNYESAIYHLENALKFVPEEYTSDLILDYCVIIKCYIELEDFDAAKNYIQKGENIIIERNISVNSPSNNHFKEVYIEFMCLKFFVNQDFDQFVSCLEEKLIPILKTHNKHFEIGFYYGHLGNTYMRIGEFEKSAYSLLKAKIAYKELMAIKEE
ncbi:helix-turn-helix domain-containing protein [Planococcus sp. X10-3]|uniref:helix-turn-helix domain-containing protein n=1 Tax=Planococcus sp. X10-3 TaxID=3061240 RepID=UPI003BAF0EEB